MRAFEVIYLDGDRLFQRAGHSVVDVKGVAWFYTRNPEFFSHKFFPGIGTQSEQVASFEGQLSASFKPWWGISEENVLLIQSG
jgi:hypothetical protein